MKGKSHLKRGNRRSRNVFGDFMLPESQLKLAMGN